jgi:23S rRNA (cytosine1962-C5)-methyltransferase
VDSSQTALDWAQRNAQANGVSVAVQKGDAFDVLESLHAQGERFDVLVVDPPAFIKRRKDLPKGEAAYRKLNQLALRLAMPEALLVSCSCSWHLPAEALPVLLQAAASHEGQVLRIIASGDDPRQVCAAVQQAGLKSDEVVLAYVPFPDEIVLGGAWLAEGEAE